jgi:hypothetical protein
MKRKKVICEHCNKEIAVNMIKRHSGPCSRKTDRSDAVSIESISSLLENGKYSCNACMKEYARQGISTHYWLNHGDGQLHLEKSRKFLNELHISNVGKPAWNSGKTAKTDARIAKSAETLQKKFKSGELKKSMLGRTQSPAAKEKLSEARSRFLNEKGNGGFLNVKWYYMNDSFDNPCSLRGTWELKVAGWLNKQSIAWTRKFYVKYIDEDVNRTYSPDFYIPKDNLIIEVKGYFSSKDRKKMQLVETQHPELKIKFIMQKEINNLDTMHYSEI